MKSTFVPRNIFCFALATALPFTASAATVIVDGNADDPGVSYQKLSSAVTWANTAPSGPHTINVVADHTDNAPIVISASMTIDGNPSNVANQKAAILVDVANGDASVAANRLTNVGITQLTIASLTVNEPRCYIEIQVNGSVNIKDLIIHPNEDLASLGTAVATDGNKNARTGESVDAIRMYEPVTGTGNYTLNRVWVTGSDINDDFIPLATGAALNESIAAINTSNQNIKRWSWQSNVSDRNAVIQTVDNSASTAPTAAGVINLTMSNCMSGLGKSNALNLNAKGGTATVVGGLYGHTNRDAIRIPGDGVTLTGSPTNRLRVLRSTSSSGGDGHAIEVTDGVVELMEWVDVASLNTAQTFKGAEYITWYKSGFHKSPFRR